MLALAALLILAIALAHSYLGERYILVRLFRQSLPKLFGSDEFTKRTLRFAWHVTSVAWLGFAALLLQAGFGELTRTNVLLVTGITFATTALIALIGGRGKHLSWPVFTAIAVLSFLAL
ncbi:MAG: hypothetical protein QNJ11_01340 [Woeseiaceae bacterium]|nr:hypothetical protein [Woeseiaceae bacterium]